MEKVLSSRRCWNSDSRNLRTSPSPSASVDLPLSRLHLGVRWCAFCRISLEPEAEGDQNYELSPLC